MSRFVYDSTKVGRGLDYLKEAKQKLNGITASMNRGISTIQSANGYKYITVDFSSIKQLEDRAKSMIVSLEGLINEKIQRIEDYNAYRQEHPIKSKFADLSMGATNITRGFWEGAQSIGDGALAVAGAAGGAFGNETWKKCCEETLVERKTKRDAWFDKQYESGMWSDVEKYSSYSSKSTKASVFRGVGSAVPFVAAAVATGGASSAGTISTTTALAADSTLAAYSALGDKTSSLLVNGEDFDTAYSKGVKSAAVAGVTTFAVGKGAEKLTSLKNAAKTAKIEKTETLLIDKADDVAKQTSKAAKIEKAENAFIGKTNKAADNAAKIGKTETLLIDKSDDAVKQIKKTTTSTTDDFATGAKKAASSQMDDAATSAKKVASSQVDDEAVKTAEKKANDVFADRKAALDKKLASGEINKSEYRKALKEIHPDTATYNAKSGQTAENVAKESEKTAKTSVNSFADDTAKSTTKQTASAADSATTKQTANTADETFKNTTKQANNTTDDAVKNSFSKVDDDVVNIDDGIDVLTGDANKAAQAEKSVKGHQTIKSKIKNQFNNASVRDAAYQAGEKVEAVKEGISKAGNTFKNAGEKIVEGAKNVGSAAKTVGASAVKNPKLAGATVGATAVVAGTHINSHAVNTDMAGININNGYDAITAKANRIFVNEDVASQDEEDKSSGEETNTDTSGSQASENGGDNGNGNGGNSNSNYDSKLAYVDNKDDKTKKILDTIVKKQKEKTTIETPTNVDVNTVVPQEPTNNNVNPNPITPEVATNTNSTPTQSTVPNYKVESTPINSGSSNQATTYTGATTVKHGATAQASYANYSGGNSNTSVASVTKDVINKTKSAANTDIGSKVKSIIGDKKINPIVIDDTTSSGRRSGVGLAVGGVVAAGAALGIGTKAVLDKRRKSEEYEDEEVFEETGQNDGYDVDSAVYDNQVENNEEVEMLYDDPYKANEGSVYDDSYDDIAYGEAEDLVTF